MVRVLRFQASLPIKFWECVLPGTFTINCIPTLQLWGKSPYENFLGKKINLDPQVESMSVLGIHMGKKVGGFMTLKNKSS